MCSKGGTPTGRGDLPFTSAFFFPPALRVFWDLVDFDAPVAASPRAAIPSSSYCRDHRAGPGRDPFRGRPRFVFWAPRGPHSRVTQSALGRACFRGWILVPKGVLERGGRQQFVGTLRGAGFGPERCARKGGRQQVVGTYHSPVRFFFHLLSASLGSRILPKRGGIPTRRKAP